MRKGGRTLTSFTMIVKKIASHFVFILILFSLSSIAFAEYYIVRPGCGTPACYKPVKRPACYKTVKKRPSCYRRVKKVTRCQRPACPVIVERVYAKAPPCPCNGCDPMGYCGGPMEGWFPTAWETYNYLQFYTEPEFYVSPNRDLATGDDDAFMFPEMNIDR